mgnify:CR=1 FL=1
MKKSKISAITYIGVTAALIAACSLISIPMPWGVPVTLQTFAIAFAGYFLGSKNGTVSVLVYILLGAVGIPVFAGFKGGFSVLVGLTGGFISGFILLAFLCGAAVKSKNKMIKVVFSFCGILATHLLGVIQFSVISSTPVLRSFLTVSLPFIVKDFASLILAFLLAVKIRNVLYSRAVSPF